MKLVRLATSNNGYFKNGFQNEMIIEPYSKMALLNLTFQSTIGSLDIGEGVKITTEGDSGKPGTKLAHSMSGEKFENSQAGYNKFKSVLQYDLNKTLTLQRGRTENFNTSGSAYRIATASDGKELIIFRYCPYINPMAFVMPQEGDGSGRFEELMEFDDEFMQSNTTVQAVGPPTRLEVDTTIIPTALAERTIARTNNLLSDHPIAMGSGFMYARVADIIDNSSGLQDNGFAIGFTTGNSVEVGDDIPRALIFAEIRINRPLEKYRFTGPSDIGSGAEETSTVDPLKVATSAEANGNLHDIMAFEISAGKLTLCVYQDATAPANRNVLETYNIPEGTTLFPYLYINGTILDVEIDLFNWTADSLFNFTPGNLDPNQDPGFGWGPGSELSELYDTEDITGMRNGIEKLQIDTAAIQIARVLPVPYYNVDVRRYNQDITFSLTMEAQLWNSLGFIEGFSGVAGAKNIEQTVKINVTASEGNAYQAVFRADTLPISYQSDNFIVESMSLPLDSFDASAVEYDGVQVFNPGMEFSGRRKNILATIPVNDNTDGLVEFQTNTPIFIDINNSEKLNVKNLDFRILKKDFNPIKQEGSVAIMTVLLGK